LLLILPEQDTNRSGNTPQKSMQTDSAVLSGAGTTIVGLEMVLDLMHANVTLPGPTPKQIAGQQHLELL
jgi:hypothetical protein